MRPWIAALALALVVLLSSCATPPAIHAGPTSNVDRVAERNDNELLAGAAKVDITPMPGIPLGGHSVESGVGYGVWTRLWARAIYWEDAGGEPLVLVAVDLWSVPAGLTDAVVERVREHHGLTQIGRAQLLLAATHTHHSPANYSSLKFYNRMASTMAGFDPELHAFLVERIAKAVASAAAGRVPARVSVTNTSVDSIARNRSTAPFAENPEAALILAANAELAPCPDAPADASAPDVDPCRAIDPTLTVVRVDDLDGRPLALAAFFAVHATAMVNATDLYNGDLFAVATARAEAALGRIRSDAGDPLGDPVVALFNGAEGDVSPQWEAQGLTSALRLGARLGDAIVDTALPNSGERHGCGRGFGGTIESRFARIPLADQAVASPPGAHTAARALPGRAIFGGAEDGRTRFAKRLPEGQTVARPRRSGQGPKKPAVAPAIYALVFPASTMPQEAPLSVHQIGPLTIVGLPGEFTTIMGMRIRSALTTGLASGLPEGAPRPILIGLAGDYLSYFVTPQEYALQHYEGAATMWGQYAGTLIAERMAALAEAPRAGSEAVPNARFDPGATRRFALRGARAKRVLRDLEAKLAAQLGVELEAVPRLRFETAAPDWSAPIWPTVRVEIADADGHWAPFVRDGARVDERGPEFVTFPNAITRDRWGFTIAWIGWIGSIGSTGEVPKGASVRLHGFGPDGSEHCSAPFEVGQLASAEAVACAPHEVWPGDPRDGIGVVPASSSTDTYAPSPP